MTSVQTLQEPSLIEKGCDIAVESITEADKDKIPLIRAICSAVALSQLSPEQAASRVEGLIGNDEPMRKFEAFLKSQPLLLRKLQRVKGPGGVLYRKKARRWSKEEDERLAEAIRLHGTENWPLVSSIVGGGRTRSQCSQRWHRCLNPKIAKHNWSREEEEKLISLVAAHGNKAWTRIAAEIGNRSDVQCRFRYKFMSKKSKEAGNEVQPISLGAFVGDGDFGYQGIVGASAGLSGDGTPLPGHCDGANVK
jgi:hypothetical protein